MDAPGTTRVEARCPGCGRPGLQLRTVTHDVPHFGETLQTLLLCPECGFRHVDVFVVEERDPVRYVLRVREEADLSVRVVRSSSGTVRLPELGLVAEPTPRTEAFVSNVEGLLRRMRGAFEWAERVADSEEERELARERAREIDDALAGGREITVVLEDPRGNSAIVGDRARRTILTEEEAAALETGVVILDREDVDELR